MTKDGALDRAQVQGLRTLRDLVVPVSALIVVLVGVGLGIQALDLPIDDDLVRRSAGAGGRPGEIVTLTLSRIADVPGVMVVALVALLVGRRRQRWRDLAFVVVAGTIELVVFLAVTIGVERERPPVPSPDAPAWTSSYPSGHVAIVIAAGGAAAMLVPEERRQLRTVLLVVVMGLGLLVGASRIVRAQHRPSEVLAGLALGAGALAITIVTARRHGWSPEEPPAVASDAVV